jgi:hypothetical protein
MLHDITNENQGYCTIDLEQRLHQDTHFAMHCQDCRLETDNNGEDF